MLEEAEAACGIGWKPCCGRDGGRRGLGAVSSKLMLTGCTVDIGIQYRDEEV
jgi:hypothetical protein